MMNNQFLSQEEIDSLLNGGSESNEIESTELLTDIEKDLLGEVGNISMGTAATSLSTIVGQKVNITTPTIKISNLDTLKKGFEVPNVVLDVKFTSGISGGNLLIMKISDAGMIANLMMGGDGQIEDVLELSEIEISAVQEAMNQMIGSAATSMATMFNREVNISPPISSICDEDTANISQDIKEHEEIVCISFKMTIGTLIDSSILQILPIATARKIIDIMMGTEESDVAVEEVVIPQQEETWTAPAKEIEMHSNSESSIPQQTYEPAYNMPVAQPQQVNVKGAAFKQLDEASVTSLPKNIDLILDVPLELSVELGRTKKNIKDILSLSQGSLIELNKLAEEPVDIFVNGKKIAYGEVVVIDESFGVKITGIVSGEDRIRSLSK